MKGNTAPGNHIQLKYPESDPLILRCGRCTKKTVGEKCHEDIGSDRKYRHRYFEPIMPLNLE